MKKILILSIDTNFENSLSDKIRPFYEYLSKTWEENNVQFYRSSVYEYNSKLRLFHRVQKYEGNSWRIETNIKPDLIWYKSNAINYLTRKIENDFIFINNSLFTQLANNKFITSQIFSEESPKTLILNQENLKSFKKDEEVIIKPDGGSGWQWVEKLLLRDINDKKIKESQWYIIQELIDCSGGISSIVDWIHDIRFFIYGNNLGNEVVLRTPPKDDFRCNISQGWESKNFSIEKLPSDLKSFVTSIHKKIIMEFWPLFWSIDVVRANNRYYLIEFNSSPWVNLHPIETPRMKSYHLDIIDLFKTMMK